MSTPEDRDREHRRGVLQAARAHDPRADRVHAGAPDRRGEARPRHLAVPEHRRPLRGLPPRLPRRRARRHRGAHAGRVRAGARRGLRDDRGCDVRGRVARSPPCSAAPARRIARSARRPRWRSSRPSPTHGRSSTRLVFPGFVAAHRASRTCGACRCTWMGSSTGWASSPRTRRAIGSGRTRCRPRPGRYLEAGGTLPLRAGLAPNLVRARWMLEELRLSLFAQHIPTAESVSLQRITKVLANA